MSAGYTRVVAKVAVSVPDDVFRAADEEAHRRGMTRSALYTEALREFVGHRERVDAAIVAGYLAQPQDADIDVEAVPPMHADLGPYP